MDFIFKEDGLIPRRDAEEAQWSRERRGSAAVLTQEVVPVFGCGAQAVDGGMKVAHALGQGVTGGIGVKARSRWAGFVPGAGPATPDHAWYLSWRLRLI